MQNAELIHYVFMLLAIVLEVAANILIKYSDGFRKRMIGTLGIISILASFTSLSQAVKGIDLSVAYALWGGIGILLTSSTALVLFRQRLNRVECSGVAAIFLGVILLKLA
ncbi:MULTISPECIES: multidrug/spermidine efflux SMR transporter subunit MdtI [Oceanimonas]|uniref:Spermidine export protein MdtI n=1 Tax=Oceanimonas smirnovii TaxID=264574 RepID=A0ABW7NXK5_9GAMM|nr:multidrug/spermidine efflux SMR transporter subunit MdtI [Oceanimonas sp. CAM02]MDV2858589.1 multidrug/spermidine efflux SMR transporter subunit MdtI [Oceanimonas sp. CAM02]